MGKAAAQSTAETAEATQRTIEDLAREQKTPAWVLAGATVHYGWGAGLEMTEAEYQQAIARFLKSPVGGETR